MYASEFLRAIQWLAAAGHDVHRINIIIAHICTAHHDQGRHRCAQSPGVPPHLIMRGVHVTRTTYDTEESTVLHEKHMGHCCNSQYYHEAKFCPLGVNAGRQVSVAWCSTADSDVAQPGTATGPSSIRHTAAQSTQHSPHFVQLLYHSRAVSTAYRCMHTDALNIHTPGHTQLPPAGLQEAPRTNSAPPLRSAVIPVDCFICSRL